MSELAADQRGGTPSPFDSRLVSESSKKLDEATPSADLANRRSLTRGQNPRSSFPKWLLPRRAPRFPWRSMPASCQDGARSAQIRRRQSPRLRTAAAGTHTRRPHHHSRQHGCVAAALGDEARDDSPGIKQGQSQPQTSAGPVAEGQPDGLFQTKVRLQTASPHAPERTIHAPLRRLAARGGCGRRSRRCGTVSGLWP